MEENFRNVDKAASPSKQNQKNIKSQDYDQNRSKNVSKSNDVLSTMIKMYPESSKVHLQIFQKCFCMLLLF